MRQVVCPKPGTLLVREAPIPEPSSPGEVLVRVRTCGICGSDLHWYRGESTPPAVCPGHELTGVVAAVGPEVRGLREGDRVLAEGIRACGVCAYCESGRPQLCRTLAILGLEAEGGFADYVVTDERHLHAVPAALDDETAQLAEPLAAAVHAMRLARVGSGQRVLILGAGALGLLSIPAALGAGAGEVTLSARRPHQADAARALGAHGVLDAARFRERTVSDFDVVVDTVADADRSLDDAIGACAPGGTAVVVGVFTRPARIDALRLMTEEIRLIGAMCYGSAGGTTDLAVALDILGQQGEVLRRNLVTHRVALDDIAEGFRLAADKTTGSIKVSVGISAPDSAVQP